MKTYLKLLLILSLVSSGALVKAMNNDDQDLKRAIALSQQAYREDSDQRALALALAESERQHKQEQAQKSAQETKKQAEKTTIKLSEESQKIRTALINKYKPNSENTRPIVRHSITDKSGVASSFNTLIYDFDSIITCMLTGFKNVCWDLGDLKLFEAFQKSSLEMQKLIKEYGISCFLLSDTEHNPEGMLIFTQTGRKNALLLLKAQNDLDSLEALDENDYVIGYLLGYSERDIKAFYIDTEHGHLFEQHKKQALAWIAKESPKIEEWFAKHVKQQRCTLLN